VEPEAVDLDDDPLASPQEVDLVAADADVRLRRRQLRRPDQREESFLRLGPGQRPGDVGLDE
jgi:hypothetical protein